MEHLNDKRVILSISKELDIASSLVDGVVSSFFSNVAKEIETSHEDVAKGIEKIIEIKHLGKFITKKSKKKDTCKKK